MNSMLKITMLFCLTCGLALPLRPAQAGERPAPLMIRNSFATPEEALHHFLRRDESGAFWAGMLEPERRAFTTWTQDPQAESYVKFKAREFGATRKISTDEVAIPVSLSGIEHTDAFGTRMPASTRQNPLQQVYRLKKIDGRWKIVQPEANAFTPAIKLKSR